MINYKQALKTTDSIPRGIHISSQMRRQNDFILRNERDLGYFMTKYLIDSSGNPDVMSEESAKVWYHILTSAVYFSSAESYSFRLVWANIERFFIFVVYCLGHLSLAFMDLHMFFLEPRDYLMLGLILIAVGSGGIKPCVSLMSVINWLR